MFWSRFWSILLLVIYLTSFMSSGYLFDDILDTCNRIKIRLNKNPYLHNIPQQDSSVLSYRIVCIHCHLDCILVAEHYLQIFTNIYNYLQLLTNIYNYLQLFTIIYIYLQLFTINFNYLQLFTILSHRDYILATEHYLQLESFFLFLICSRWQTNSNRIHKDFLV